MKLSSVIECLRCFDSNNTMSFKVTDKELFKKCPKIWEKYSSLWIKNFIVNLFMVFIPKLL